MPNVNFTCMLVMTETTSMILNDWIVVTFPAHMTLSLNMFWSEECSIQIAPTHKFLDLSEFETEVVWS